MLHDLARLYSTTQLLEECERRGMPVDDFERRNPIVLHAPLGAVLAREQFGIEDAAVLSAITKHTLGAEEMSQLDCIVYLADALEPGRDFENRSTIWKLAQSDFTRQCRRRSTTRWCIFRTSGVNQPRRRWPCSAFFPHPFRREFNHR